MKIAFVVSEVEDIIKTGGLADVAKALPVALTAMGHDVKVFLPAYSKALNNIDQSDNVTVLSTTDLADFTLVSASLNGLDVYLIKHPYFDRPELYAQNNQAYDDNGERFTFFNLATLHALEHLDFTPDVVSCHDWHTGLMPFFLKEHAKRFSGSRFTQTKSVISIHNAAFQGHFAYHDIPSLMPYIDALRHLHHHDVNMLRTGIAFADKITTVSETYAQEILTDLGSHGLSTALQSRAMDLKGILNGCDYTQWDPSTDPYIAQHFDSANMQGKKACKAQLQETFSLPIDAGVPVIGMVCRVTTQKGFGYLIPILKSLMMHNFQLAIVGSGDPQICGQLRDFSRIHSDKFSFIEGFSVEYAHIVEAGADFFLMPSEFEPCGLNQMYSLAYGTLPIVRKVGGLKDTVVGIDDDLGRATGITFSQPSGRALLNAIRQALLLYRENPARFAEIQKRAMKTKFTWQDAAQKYALLFKQMH